MTAPIKQRTSKKSVFAISKLKNVSMVVCEPSHMPTKKPKKNTTDNWTVVSTIVLKEIRFDPNQSLSLTRLHSVAVKASATTTGRNTAPAPSVTTTVAEICTHDYAPATYFDKATVPVIISLMITYHPSFQSNGSSNLFDVKNHSENLVWLPHSVKSAGLIEHFPSQSNVSLTESPKQSKSILFSKR